MMGIGMPLQQNLQITILAVANGWIVQTPNGMQLQQEFRKQMKDIKNIMQERDPLLYPDENEDESNTIKRDTSCHVFKTFPEVLAFLDFQIKTLEA